MTYGEALDIAQQLSWEYHVVIPPWPIGKPLPAKAGCWIDRIEWCEHHASQDNVDEANRYAR